MPFMLQLFIEVNEQIPPEYALIPEQAGRAMLSGRYFQPALRSAGQSQENIRNANQQIPQTDRETPYAIRFRSIAAVLPCQLQG